MNHEEYRTRQDTVTVDVDGHRVEIAYYEDGPADGEPLVFVHGIPTWGFLWREVAPEFTDDYRVVVPDLAGYGSSEKTDGFDRSIRAQEQVIEGLVDELDIATPLNLVSHDIGGGVASRYAAHSPEAVSTLVVSNAVCYDSWPVEFVNDLGLPGTAELPFDELEENLDFAFGGGVHGDESEHAEFIEGMKAPWMTDAGRRSLSRCAVATNTNHTTELDYAEITADTLCLWGGDDILQPVSYAEWLAEDVSGAGEVVTLDDAYHWVMEDRPKAYTEELRAFL
ncbi:alpha/beta hydrolase [Salarchaeum sp. JOR-1]|nr:alpha/beta hydrolase [Salarchaeum sp. JOR-1]QDX40934.1 alpha/beta hydrolase [Salarchaeum sp. JOR-1]